MSTLFVPATRRSSLGVWAFPVAAARAWNTLPVSLHTASSFLTFRRELKNDMLYVHCEIKMYIFILYNLR